ncbi:MAG TPA: glycosyltransferase family 39 protein [Solirubrobacteraceae bacterium]|nr:glycosyltransferase family 39 protein [Solirubrobacteraceae bacterium]
MPLGLLAIMLLALVLRTTELGIGFWIDEGLSVGISDRPLADIPHALRLDGSPPLYYVLMHLWMALAGTSEAATRWFSVLCALIMVPVAWWGARMLFGSRAGWMAAILIATNPFMTRFAQEARMYALVALLALIACAAFGRAFTGDDPERARRPWAITLAVTLAAMLYTHNWSLFFGAACGAVWLFLVFRTPSGRARHDLLVTGAIGFGGAALLYLPWVPTTLYQAAHTGAPWSNRPDMVDLLGSLGQMVGQFAQVALILCAGAGLGALWQRNGGRLSPAGRAAACLLAIGVITVILAWLSSQVSPAWASRYLAVGVAPLTLVAAAGLAHAGRLGIAGLIVAAALAAGDTAPSEKSNVRDVAQAIGPSLRPGDLVVVTQPEQVAVLAYYLPEGVRFATLTGELEDTGVTDWRDGPERLSKTSATKDLKPLMDELRPGQRMALVQPILYDIRRWQAPWTKLVRVRSDEWRQFAGNDSRFSIAATAPELPTERRNNGQKATVFVKTRE